MSLAVADAELVALAGRLPTPELLAHAIRHRFAGGIVLVSSFGTESAVLLHMVAQIDHSMPVIFLDTGKLFGETLAYRDALVRRLGLTDLRTVAPDPQAIAAADPAGDLWQRDGKACCALRKVAPLHNALQPFAAWINGRKRFQGGLRNDLPAIETVDGRIKINALANWRESDIARYFAAHRLPRHPLQSDGYGSIGCTPCTDRVTAGQDARAGRWRGQERTECGIHLAGSAPATERGVA